MTGALRSHEITLAHSLLALKRELHRHVSDQPLVLTVPECEQLARSRSMPHLLVRRANIVLLSGAAGLSSGHPYRSVLRRKGRPIGKWQQLYILPEDTPD